MNSKKEREHSFNPRRLGRLTKRLISDQSLQVCNLELSKFYNKAYKPERKTISYRKNVTQR